MNLIPLLVNLQRQKNEIGVCVPRAERRQTQTRITDKFAVMLSEQFFTVVSVSTITKFAVCDHIAHATKVLSTRALDLYTLGAIFTFIFLRTKTHKHRKVQLRCYMYSFLLRIDIPMLHDEVANNYQSAIPLSTRNTASNSPSPSETTSSNKRSFSAHISTSVSHSPTPSVCMHWIYVHRVHIYAFLRHFTFRNVSFFYTKIRANRACLCREYHAWLQVSTWAGWQSPGVTR